MRPDGLDEVKAYLDEFWGDGLAELKHVVESDQRRGKSRDN